MDRMDEIIRLLTLKQFNPSKYPNPALQWHYRILQAIALEEELPEKPEDKTLPKYRRIHERIGAEAISWGELLDSAVPAGHAEPVKSTTKRKTVTNGDDMEDRPKVKREKKKVEAPSRDKVESLYEQGTLMTVTPKLVMLANVVVEVGSVEGSLCGEENCCGEDKSVMC